MKKLFFVFILSFFNQNVNAQLFSNEKLLNGANNDMKALSWGYFLGFNDYSYNFDYKEQTQGDNTDILVIGEAGFNVGLLGNLRINNYLDLRLEPGLSFTSRNFLFPGFDEVNDYLREVK